MCADGRPESMRTVTDYSAEQAAKRIRVLPDTLVSQEACDMIVYVSLCKRCGNPLMGPRNSKYCPACSEEVHRIQARECSRRYRMREKIEGPMDWIGQLSEAERTIPIKMQQMYGEHFVQVVNEKIRLVEKLLDAGLVS